MTARVRSLFWGLLAGLLLGASTLAQPPGLPSELFVLTNDGIVQRYGVNFAGGTAVTPESMYVLDFGVDQPGERLAFRTEEGLRVSGLSGGEGVPLDTSASAPPYRGAGRTIVWSPASDGLAYTTLDGLRVYLESGGPAAFINLGEGLFQNLSWSPGGSYLAAETPEHIWWIYERKDDQMQLASVIPSSLGAAWVSGSEIVFAPPEGGLRLMNLAAGNAQTVLLDEHIEYRLPALTRDDQLVFFARARDDAAVPEGYGVLHRLARGASQVERIGQAAVPLAGLQWAPGGELMTLLQGGALALFDPITGAGMPLPVSSVVAFDWLPLTAVRPTPTAILPTVPADEPAATLTAIPLPAATPVVQEVDRLILSADAYFLAPDGAGVRQVWRLPRTGATAFRFTAAPRDVSEYAISPDGRNIAYIAGGQLWVQRYERPQPFVIAELNGFTPGTPAFSPDGLRVAYADESETSGGIWEAALDGRDPVRLLANDSGADTGQVRIYRRPQYSPDGQRMLLDAYTDTSIDTAVLTLSSASLAVQEADSAQDLRALTARWLRDGRILTYTDAASPDTVTDAGLYLLDAITLGASPARWIPLTAGAVVRDVLQISGDQFRVALTGGEGTPVRVIDLAGLNQHEIAVLPPLIAPNLTPDGRFVAAYESLDEINGVRQGPLLIADLERGGLFRWTQPPLMSSFRWVE